MDPNRIIQKLPYTKPFLFVDELLEVDTNGAKGTFTFRKDLDFYQGHFRDNPVTPGVILTECCAQIGLVCLGIYLLDNNTSATTGNTSVTTDNTSAATNHNNTTATNNNIKATDNINTTTDDGTDVPLDLDNIINETTENFQIGMSSSEMEFLLPVFPDEKVRVTSEKLYFRFHKLKCTVKMYNSQGQLVCKGEIAGMIKSGKHG